MERLYAIIEGSYTAPLNISGEQLEKIRKSEGVISADVVNGRDGNTGVVVVFEGTDREAISYYYLMLRDERKGTLPSQVGQDSQSYFVCNPQE